jgi:hypothetical protein
VSVQKVNKKESIRVNVNLPRKDYYIGEAINVKIKIENNIDKKVLASQFKISIIQSVKVHHKTFQVSTYFIIKNFSNTYYLKCEFEENIIASETFKFKGFKLDVSTSNLYRIFTLNFSRKIPPEREFSVY